MHTTTVKLKNGEEFTGVLWEWKPEENRLLFIRCGPTMDGKRHLTFDDIESAITHGVRTTISTVEDQDELERAKEWLRTGRRAALDAGRSPVPLMEWEVE